jgi:hypothetical protein
MNFIDDIERLVAEPARNGQPLIEPRNSDNSLIVQRMRDGSMPPTGSTGPRPSASDIRTVANFIDNPNFWPEPARRDCTGQEISYDEIYQRVQADLFSQDADDRPFTRYLSLTNRYNAGICSDDLDRDRWAMAKMVNMLSINTGLVEPVAIDREQTLYRINLRDYDWNREVEVEGEDFDDLWEAFITIDPYAVPFVGDEADTVRLQSETDLAVLNVDMLLDTAIVGNLYYAAIGIDVDETLDEFIRRDLGIDDGFIARLADFKLNGENGRAWAGDRIHVLDAFDLTEHLLHGRGDETLDLLGAGTGERHGDVGHRDGDLRLFFPRRD